MYKGDGPAIDGMDACEASRASILLVDNHTLERQALKALLETHAEVEIVGEAATYADGLKAAETLKPCVAVVEVGLPDGSGIEFAAELKARRSSVGVLIFTAQNDGYFAALNAGALGYVVKSASYAKLLQGIRAVSIGKTFLCVCEPAEAAKVPVAAQDEHVIEPSHVTKREGEVLTRIALGLTSKEIARSLRISYKTVEKYRCSLTRKFDVRGLAGLTTFAINKGFADSTWNWRDIAVFKAGIGAANGSRRSKSDDHPSR